MALKTSDSKGRIAFGPAFANKTFIIETIDDTEFRVIAVSVIPEREMWIYRNKNALESLDRGLEQAKARKFSKNPPSREDLQPLGD